jgi:hypothetical protein
VEETKRRMPKSKRRVSANRRNGRKSQGPVTDEGKAISRQNALTHGMLAQHVLISSFDPAEHEEELAALLEGLMEDFKPKTTKERMLVERMAASYWRLRRAYRFEARCIDDARKNELENPFAAIGREMTGKKANPLRFILPDENQLDKLVRYEGIIDRALNRSLIQIDRARRLLCANSQSEEDQEVQTAGQVSEVGENSDEPEMNDAEIECDRSR